MEKAHVLSQIDDLKAKTSPASVSPQLLGNLLSNMLTYAQQLNTFPISSISQSASTSTRTITLHINYENGDTVSFSLPSATLTSAGLMSSDQATKLVDAYNTGIVNGKSIETINQELTGIKRELLMPAVFEFCSDIETYKLIDEEPQSVRGMIYNTLTKSFITWGEDKQYYNSRMCNNKAFGTYNVTKKGFVPDRPTLFYDNDETLWLFDGEEMNHIQPCTDSRIDAISEKVNDTRSMAVGNSATLLKMISASKPTQFSRLCNYNEVDILDSSPAQEGEICFNRYTKSFVTIVKGEVFAQIYPPQPAFGLLVPAKHGFVPQVPTWFVDEEELLWFFDGEDLRKISLDTEDGYNNTAIRARNANSMMEYLSNEFYMGGEKNIDDPYLFQRKQLRESKNSYFQFSGFVSVDTDSIESGTYNRDDTDVRIYFNFTTNMFVAHHARIGYIEACTSYFNTELQEMRSTSNAMRATRGGMIPVEGVYFYDDKRNFYIFEEGNLKQVDGNGLDIINLENTIDKVNERLQASIEEISEAASMMEGDPESYINGFDAKCMTGLIESGNVEIYKYYCNIVKKNIYTYKPKTSKDLEYTVRVSFYSNQKDSKILISFYMATSGAPLSVRVINPEAYADIKCSSNDSNTAITGEYCRFLPQGNKLTKHYIEITPKNEQQGDIILDILASNTDAKVGGFQSIAKWGGHSLFFY